MLTSHFYMLNKQITTSLVILATQAMNKDKGKKLDQSLTFSQIGSFLTEDDIALSIGGVHGHGSKGQVVFQQDENNQSAVFKKLYQDQEESRDEGEAEEKSSVSVSDDGAEIEQPSHQDLRNLSYAAETSRAEKMTLEQLRVRQRELDNTIRLLNREKSRVRMFIQKGEDATNSDFQPNMMEKECLCCGKLITKLCFRCEHIYCQDPCPRKKKQRLNARMLSKMKNTKKAGAKGQGRERSRDKMKKLSYRSDHSEEELDIIDSEDEQTQEEWEEESVQEERRQGKGKQAERMEEEYKPGKGKTQQQKQEFTSSDSLSFQLTSFGAQACSIFEESDEEDK